MIFTTDKTFGRGCPSEGLEVDVSCEISYSRFSQDLLNLVLAEGLEKKVQGSSMKFWILKVTLSPHPECVSCSGSLSS